MKRKGLNIFYVNSPKVGRGAVNSLEDIVFGTLTDISERVIENVQCPYGYQETYCYLKWN